MKKTFKLLSVVILFFSITISTEAQGKQHEKEKKEIKKELHLTKKQKKEMRSFHRSMNQEKAAIQNNTALTEEQKKVQLAQLKKEKQDKLEVILTPDQKVKMKDRKENTPRRGVTNMPNERTAK